MFWSLMFCSQLYLGLGFQKLFEKLQARRSFSGLMLLDPYENQKILFMGIFTVFSLILFLSFSLVLGLWVSFSVKINQVNWSKLNNLDFGCRMRPLSKWSNVTQFDVTNGNEDQTVTMPKIEMNSENFYFEHDKHPATNNIKEEPNWIKVSI